MVGGRLIIGGVIAARGCMGCAVGCLEEGFFVVVQLVAETVQDSFESGRVAIGYAFWSGPRREII